jgi:hypothetical protein
MTVRHAISREAKLNFTGLMALALGPVLVTSLTSPADAAACPANVLMDVSRTAGPGAGYERPRVSARCAGNMLVVRSNGMPHYRFVQITPNPLRAQNYVFRVPVNPRRASRTTRIPLLGGVGFAVNGVIFYGPNEAAFPAGQAYGDPVFNGIMDRCMGHTAREYHYHAFVQSCLAPRARAGKPSPVLGFAFDGFPIHGSWGCLDRACKKVVQFKSGYVRTASPARNAWQAHRWVKRKSPIYLDRCNGRVGPDGQYRYHATNTFPYIIGCYAGTPEMSNRRRGGGPRGRGPGGPGGPGVGPPPRGGPRGGPRGRDGPGPRRAGAGGCTLTAAGGIVCR